MRKKINFNVALVAIVILYIVLILLPDSVGRGSDVKIYNLGQKSERSTGDLVHIAYVSINDIKIPVEQLNLSGIYNSGEDGYSFDIVGGNEVVVNTKKFNRIEIAIEKTQDSGYVSLTDGKKTRKINLVSTGERMYYHPEVTPIYDWIMLIVAVVAIYIIIYFVVQMINIWLADRKKEIFLKQDFFWIMLNCIATRLYYWRYFPEWFVISPDTDSYVNYATTEIRTPLYPSIINFFQLFSDDLNQVYKTMVFFQSVLGVISIYIFYRIVSDLTTKRGVRLYLTVALANLPMIIFYEHYIMTESIGIFLTLCIVRTVQLFICKPRVRYGVGISVICALLIMQRPAFLFIIPLLAFFYFLYAFVEKQKTALSICLLSIPIIACLTCCVLNYKAAGRFEISYVSTVWNQGLEITNGNMYDDPEYEDISETISEYKIDYGNDHWSYVWEIFGQYGNEYSNFVKEVGKYNARELLLMRIRRFVNQCDSKITESNLSRNIYASYNPQMIEIDDNGLHVELLCNFIFMPITMGQSFILILGGMIYYIHIWLKDRHVPWIQLGIISMMFCTVLVSFWKGYGDFVRLMITMLPMIEFVIADILERVNIQKNRVQQICN